MTVPASPAARAAILVTAFFLLRLGLAATIPFTVDEAYAVVVSRAHSLSYFDHPPIGFALARLMADIFGCECPFLVRLPYVILGSLSAWLLFDLSSIAYGAEAAFWATAWYSVAPFFFISAGHFVVPDGPLDFFLLLSALAVAPLMIGKERGPAISRWLVAGTSLSFALMSKYQAGLFCVSAALVLIGTPWGRRQLCGPGPWLAGIIAALGMLPMIIWNMRHQWVSFVFQSGRALESGGSLLHLGNLMTTLVGQVGYVWPPVWAVAMLMIWRACKTDAIAADKFFMFLSAVPIAFFDLVALISSRSLPHWSMSGFLFAFPLVGKWCESHTRLQSGLIQRSLGFATVLVPLLAASFAIQTRTGALTRPFFTKAPKFDVNWQSVDWSQLRAYSGRLGLSGPNAYVIAPNWDQAGKIGASLGPEVPIGVLPGDPRHFQFMNDLRLGARRQGFFVGGVDFGHEEVRSRQFRAQLHGHFEITGAAIWVVQDLFGFPDFEIMILPVRRL